MNQSHIEQHQLFQQAPMLASFEHRIERNVAAPSKSASPADLTNQSQTSSEDNGPLRFPLVLYDMLESVEKEGLDRIVSWVPPSLDDGSISTTFRVHDIAKFEKLVLPKYFNTSRYKSFQRNLNVHHFSRANRKATYTHWLLRRGRRDLCEQIRRPSKAQPYLKPPNSASTSNLDNATSTQMPLREGENTFLVKVSQHLTKSQSSWEDTHGQHLLQLSSAIVQSWCPPTGGASSLELKAFHDANELTDEIIDTFRL